MMKKMKIILMNELNMEVLARILFKRKVGKFLK